MNHRWIQCSFFILLLIVLSSFCVAQSKTNNPLTEQLFKRGIQHFNNYDYLLASRFFIKFLSHNPGSYKARDWLAKAYYQSGYVDEAIQQWNYYLELKQNPLMIKNKLRQHLRQLSITSENSFEPNEIYLPSFNLLGDSSKKKGLNIKNPTQVFVDKSQYWILGFGSNNIVILDKNRRKIKELNSKNSPIKQPYKMVRKQQGNYLISDYANNTIHEYNSVNAKWVRSIKGSFIGPAGITTDMNGHIYVVDQGNHQIQKLNSKGNFLFRFGQSQLRFPSDIAISKNHIYVSNTDHGCIEIFDLNGSWIQSIGKGLFKKPQGIYKVSDTHLLVADTEVGIISFNTKSLELQKLQIKSENNIRPSHVVLEDNQFLHFNHQNNSAIFSFSPKRYQYTNLFISMIKTNVYSREDYLAKLEQWLPRESSNKKLLTVQHQILIQDANGKHIQGLNANNVKLSINNNAFSSSDKVLLTPMESIANNESHVIILNQKSLPMKSKTKELEQTIQSVLKEAKTSDKLEFMNFHDQFWTPQKKHWTTDQMKYLLPQEIKKGPFKKETSIGQALYSSIDRLIRSKSRKKAIVIIHSSESEMLFNPYSYDICLNYAKNNHVPIYIIDFSHHSKHSVLRSKMQNIANKTNGKYFHGYTAQKIPQLMNDVRNQNKHFYLLQYQLDVAKKSMKKWLNVSLQVHYRGLFGQDKIGYYLSYD